MIVIRNESPSTIGVKVESRDGSAATVTYGLKPAEDQFCGAARFGVDSARVKVTVWGEAIAQPAEYDVDLANVNSEIDLIVAADGRVLLGAHPPADRDSCLGWPQVSPPPA